MSKLSVLGILFVLAVLLSVTFVSADVHAADESACWGQASAVFAQMGEMGEHASQQPTPRLGLRNLARALYEAGILPDDSMQSLGAFVVDLDPDLSVDACM